MFGSLKLTLLLSLMLNVIETLLKTGWYTPCLTRIFLAMQGSNMPRQRRCLGVQIQGYQFYKVSIYCCKWNMALNFNVFQNDNYNFLNVEINMYAPRSASARHPPPPREHSRRGARVRAPLTWHSRTAHSQSAPRPTGHNELARSPRTSHHP